MPYDEREPRMDFAAAARCWGTERLKDRLPEISDGVADTLVGLVIDLFDELLSSLLPIDRLKGCGTKMHAGGARRTFH
jgi:hypothetical protein